MSVTESYTRFVAGLLLDSRVVDVPMAYNPTFCQSLLLEALIFQSGDSSELASRLPCKGKSVRNRGVHRIMPFLVIPRSLLRGGFISLKHEVRLADNLEA